MRIKDDRPIVIVTQDPLYLDRVMVHVEAHPISQELGDMLCSFVEKLFVGEYVHRSMGPIEFEIKQKIEDMITLGELWKDPATGDWRLR